MTKAKIALARSRTLNNILLCFSLTDLQTCLKKLKKSTCCLVLLTNKALNSDRTTINFKPLKSPLCESLRKDRISQNVLIFCSKNTNYYLDLAC